MRFWGLRLYNVTALAGSAPGRHAGLTLVESFSSHLDLLAIDLVCQEAYYGFGALEPRVGEYAM